jgi:signal peptidase II
MAQKPKEKKAKSLTKPTEVLSTSCSSPCIWPYLGLGLAGLIFFLDQLSKWVVLNHFMVPPQTFRVTSFLNIILAWNRGISFGLLSTQHFYGPLILAGVAITFAVLITLWICRAETKLLALAFGMVLGGAVGNLVDRVRFGAVTDFLDFHGYGYHWYTFNIADSAIVLGVALVVLEYLKEMCSTNKN